MKKTDENIKILKDARDEFAKKYVQKVQDFGYYLSTGISPIELAKKNQDLGLVALVIDLDDKGFPEDVQQKIKDTIPETYSYKRYKISVRIEYRGPIESRILETHGKKY